MKSTIRKIGNSRGVLIPASFLAACKIENEIELLLEDKRIVIVPVHTPRAGWFEGYSPRSNEGVWSEFVEVEGEDEEWEW